MFIALVPAYNESERIAEVVRSLLEKKVDEVVVIDDGSSDDTALRARDAGATVLIHEINLGQGAALETGHEYARQKKLILFSILMVMDNLMWTIFSAPKK